ncbi:TPA: hypothetical protein DDW35_10400 [Candidatus Sumerlaeota bacterium]|jgi:hypothetical protein|nr:hypothetical protein [Candidatus Sumerlaeota bacterium]
MGAVETCVWRAVGSKKYRAGCIVPGAGRGIGIKQGYEKWVKYCPHCGRRIEFKWYGRECPNVEEEKSK